jgi:hypothetical protein
VDEALEIISLRIAGDLQRCGIRGKIRDGLRVEDPVAAM